MQVTEKIDALRKIMVDSNIDAYIIVTITTALNM